MGGSPLSILNNIVNPPSWLSAENSCKIRYYENSLFFFHRNDDDWGVGYYYAACFARNYLQCRPTNKFVGWVALFFTGCVIGWFDACRKQRKKEDEEERQAEQDRTNELMREYLKKKLQEENDKQ